MRDLAVLTGAGRANNIGAGIARSLAANGWDLVLPYWPAHDALYTDDPEAELSQLITEAQTAGAEAIPIEIDFADPDSASAVFEALPRTPRALVMCHATDVASRVVDTPVAELDRHFAVNVRSSLQLIQEFAARFEGEDGRIVAFTSDAVVGSLPYGASKGALDRIVTAAARELGPQRITANLINPGPIDTGWMTTDVRDYLTGRQPLGRLGTPRDIAAVVTFLLSPAGGWINGQLLHVDGGFTAP
jgi:3-oxoacyl-[acyl-carrier protein] reductase